MQNLNIHQFVARNADIADAHEFASDHKSAINSALHRAGLPTLGGDRTMRNLRSIVIGEEVVASRPERVSTEPIAQEPTRKARKVTCNGVNLSASSANEHCARKVRLSAGERPTEALCHDHEDQRGRDYDALVWERTQNIWKAEQERAEYLARKEAREMLAEINA